MPTSVFQPESRRKKTVGVSDIELIISKIARIPAKSVSSSDKAQLKGLADKLKMVVFGQDKAIDALATSIKLARAGLREGEKPIGSFCLPVQRALVKQRFLGNWLMFLV